MLCGCVFSYETVPPGIQPVALCCCCGDALPLTCPQCQGDNSQWSGSQHSDGEATGGAEKAQLDEVGFSVNSGIWDRCERILCSLLSIWDRCERILCSLLSIWDSCERIPCSLLSIRNSCERILCYSCTSGTDVRGYRVHTCPSGTAVREYCIHSCPSGTDVRGYCIHTCPSWDRCERILH